MRWERERFLVLDRVRRTLRRWPMWEAGDLVVVAVSGGADSLVLLDVLVQLAPREGISLSVLHVDHGLRPESGEEASYVERVAGHYRLPFHAVRVEAAPAKGAGMSPEEAAREARYQVFAAEMERTGAARLATGHTADDRVETLLMRLLTGAGPRGLGGVPPVRGRYIRPLIRVWREEVQSYARFLPCPPLQDPTNLDLSIPRNRLRHQIIPFLEQNYPGVKRVLLREAETLGELGELLDTLVEEVEMHGVEETARGLESRIDHLLSLPLAAQRHLSARLLRRLGVEPDYHLLEDLLFKVVRGEGCPSLDLSPVITARREYGRLVLGPRPEALPWSETVPRPEVVIPGEGRYPLPGLEMELRVKIRPRPDRLLLPGEDDPFTAWLDADRIVFPLKVRGIKPGDRFHPLGAPGFKKLQDFLVDLKVPRAERGRVALLESAGEIAWVVGYRIDDRFKVRDSTRRVAVCRVSPP